MGLKRTDEFRQDAVRIALTSGLTRKTERYFIIHEPEPVKIEMGETGEPELVIQFQYRPDPEKTGQEGTWRKKRLAEAAEKVKALLPSLDGADDYVTALMTPAPTEKEKNRTLLERCKRCAAPTFLTAV